MCAFCRRWVGSAVLAVALSSAAAAQSAPGGRLPCPEVVKKVTRWRSLQPTVEVDITLVARELNQDVGWIERCMAVYGRRPLRPAPVHIESKEEEEEQWEINEPEEVGPEELRDAREPKPKP